MSTTDTTIASVVARLTAGVSPSCDMAAPGPSEYGVLTLAAVTRRRVDASNAKRIDASRVKPEWPVVTKNTVLVARASGSRNLVGACVLVEADDPHLILPDKVWALEMTEGRSPRTLVEFLRSAQGRRSLHAITRGSSGMWNIPQEQFLALKFPRLPSSIDKAIDLIAKTADERVRLIGKLVEAKRTFARAMSTNLLSGRLRFPEFISRPWPSSALSHHVSRVTRRNRTNLQLVLTASGEHGLVDQRGYFKKRVASVDLTKYYALRQGEFAYNRSAMLGYPFGATKRLDSYEAGALSTLYLCFAVSDPCLDSDYLTYVFESGVLDRQLQRIARVGARAHGLLNVIDDDFFSLSIPLPELDEQRRIAAVLKLIDREIQLLTAEKTHAVKQKSAVVHRLFASELGVPA